MAIFILACTFATNIEFCSSVRTMKCVCTCPLKFVCINSSLSSAQVHIASELWITGIIYFLRLQGVYKSILCTVMWTLENVDT